jgi:hypothetical protein
MDRFPSCVGAEQSKHIQPAGAGWRSRRGVPTLRRPTSSGLTGAAAIKIYEGGMSVYARIRKHAECENCHGRNSDARVTEGAFAGPPFPVLSLQTSVGVLALFGQRVRRWSQSERIMVFEQATPGNHSAPAP